MPIALLSIHMFKRSTSKTKSQRYGKKARRGRPPMSTTIASETPLRKAAPRSEFTGPLDNVAIGACHVTEHQTGCTGWFFSKNYLKLGVLLNKTQNLICVGTARCSVPTVQHACSIYIKRSSLGQYICRNGPPVRKVGMP